MTLTKHGIDWNQTRAFLTTANKGSYSAAASVLGVSQPTLSRQVAALEESLQVVLFEKSGRGLILTPTGKVLLEHATRMGEAAMDMSLAAMGSSSELHGNVCISASEILAGYLLPDLALKLSTKHPEIRIEILAANETSDLREREADIAIRSFRPKQLDLITRKLRLQYWGLYASKEYLEHHGAFDSKAALESGRFIGFDQSNSLIKHFEAQNLQVSPQNFVVVANNMMVAMELIKNGTGIGVLPVDIGNRQAGISRVADKLVEFEVENWLVTHSELRTTRRIRLVYDFLVEALST